MKIAKRFKRAAIHLCILAVAVTSLTAAASADVAIPVVTVPAGRTMIDDIGWYGVSYRYTGGRTGSQPMGWTGYFTDATGIAAMAEPNQNGKSAYLLHPIWRGGTGDTDQTYRLALPKTGPIALGFSIAMRTDAVGKSDGVTFRVFLNGKKLLDQNKADAAWSDFRYDLSSYAGQTVTLTFEADPGPKNDPSFDFGLWGDRRLICSRPQTARQRVFSPKTVSLDAVQTGWGSASPTHAAESESPKIAIAADPRPTGLLDGLAFRFDRAGGAPLPFANFASLDLVAPDGRIVSSESSEAHGHITQSAVSSGDLRRTAVYTLGGRTISVTAEIGRYDGSSVRVHLWSNDPYIAGIHYGRVGPAEFERPIIVPYYGSVDYLMKLGLFSNVVMDYGLSHASRFGDDSAEYAPLTDGSRIKLDETAYYALSPHVRSVLPTPIGGVSPYRKTMGNVAVIDYWGGNASGLADTFQDLSTYGLTHFLTIVHCWQHGGYDQQLPAVLPANDSIGGNAGVIALTSKAKSLGAMVAMHENYVDFYPNGPLYNVKDIAERPDGKLIPAWTIPGHASFLMSPVTMHKYAELITPQVHRDLGTNASYLNVHSATTPFTHTDANVERPGAGEFITTITANKSLWQLMRDVHGGPVLGEGAAHWYWSGMLDGVEAQFGYGIPQADGQDAPLFVDFDLLKMHPRQMNHGMGYPNRWLRDPATKMTQEAIDDYNMQEVAYGHSAFAQTVSLPYLWEESNLVIPVASRYATAKVRSIAYDANGVLLDTDNAIAAGTDFRRVRVAYSNGLTIWANSEPTSWTVHADGKSFVLPQYGWVASGAGVLAYHATLNGSTVSFARTAGAVYANARQMKVVDTSESPLGYAAPVASDFKQTGPRQFQIRFGFDVSRAIPAGYRIFIHLVSDRTATSAGIVAQFPSGIDAEPSSWPKGSRETGRVVAATLPSELPDGSYEIRVGLYKASSDAERLALNGEDDGTQRYTVARLTVGDSGGTIAGAAVTPPAVKTVAAGSPVDFGVVSTNGSVKLTRLGSGDWRLIPLPRDRSFEVALKGPAIDPAFARLKAIPIDAAGKSVGAAAELPVRDGRSILDVTLQSGAVGYRLISAK